MLTGLLATLTHHPFFLKSEKRNPCVHVALDILGTLNSLTPTSWWLRVLPPKDQGSPEGRGWVLLRA